MCEDNQTEATVFVLLGFQGLYEFRIILFILFFMLYAVILNGNLIIIILISTKDNLKIPMFFFLKHLALADLLISSTTVPVMLEIIIKDCITISFSLCILQLYCFCFFGFVQSFLLAIISYDRYLAICNPMHYNSIMKPHTCLNIVLGAWLLVFLLSTEITVMCRLRFCGGNRIDHFFCDSGPLIELTTSNTSILLLADFSVTSLGTYVPFAFIIITYVLIFFTIFNISSATGRKKAFSTCSSHLTTVCSYYGILMTVYLAPTDESLQSTNKFRSLSHIVLIPMLNPIIYSLRNSEIRKTLQKLIRNIQAL